jgi:hypothetical protein
MPVRYFFTGEIPARRLVRFSRFVDVAGRAGVGTLFKLFDAVSDEIALVLRGDGRLFRFHHSLNVLVHFRADEDLLLGGDTITRHPVDGVANHRELHAVRSTDKAVDHFAAMDTNSEMAIRRAALLE